MPYSTPQITLGSLTASVATSESTATTSYTALTTPGPAVTVNIGPSGLALVTITSHSFNTLAADTFHGFAVSGNTTVAANDLQSKRSSATTGFCFSGTFLVTGLTPGPNTFTSQYKVASGTGSWLNRLIAVVPL